MDTFSLILTFSLLPLLSSSSSSYSPSTSYYLNCGSASSITLQSDNPTRIFTSDTSYLTSTSTSQSLTSTSNPTSLYSTARLFTSRTSYHFTTTHPSTYILRLHFLPFSTPSHNLSSSNFSVSALDRFVLLSDFSVSALDRFVLLPDFSVSALDRFVLLSDFSVPAAANSIPLIKEFFLPVDSDSFTLTFTPNSDSAFVSAIEVFNAPWNLIDGSSPRQVPLDSNSNSDSNSVSQGLQTLYRVNVGGSLVTPSNDTLWRTWVPDNEFIFQSSLSFVNNTTASAIRYGTDPRRTVEIAPASVYDSARTMAVTPEMVEGNSNFNFNVTWSFNVEPGKSYFIRMHFCNFMFDAGYLVFNVYIGPLLAYRDLQPGQLTDDFPGAAFYMDFAAVSDLTGVMNVSIGRSNMSTPDTANAILNGLEIMKLGLDYSKNTNSSSSLWKILILAIVGSVVLVLVVILAVVLVCRRRARLVEAQPKPSPPGSWYPDRPTNSTYNSSSKSIETTNASPRVNFDLHIPFDEIILATSNFDEKLVIGSGGFGKVYKGVLRDGTKVAVKRGMPGSKQGFPEFQNEIELLSRIRHRHLVSFIGYCENQGEMILVYEFMERGTLKNYLYGSNLPCLSWKQRLEICIGAARGLHYLHTGYSHNIIHRDIKSTNILLAEDYMAKVADFGLSRIGPSFNETHVSTGVKGTIGYLDPEYFKIQKLTDKSDVYSFGVMLFEVLCARPVIDPNLSGDQLNLAEWALISQRRGQLESIIDPRLVGKINANSLRKFGETAEKCLAVYGVDRPTIGDVLWNLEYALQLQETELRREPFEDSGNVESQLSVNTVRRVPSFPSAAIAGDGSEGGGMVGVSEPSLGMTEVFSQLITEYGR